MEKSEKSKSDFWEYFEETLNQITPKRFHGVSMDRVNPETAATVKEVENSWKSDEPRGLVLTGDVGTGKTSLLYIIRKKYLATKFGQEKPILNKLAESSPNYFETKTLGQWLRDKHRWESHHSLVRELRTNPGDYATADPECLFVDDLGAGYDDEAGWNLSLLEEYFDSRWSKKLLTFISTNKRPGELRQWKNWGRIIDRLADPNWNYIVNLGEQSLRRSQ